MICHLSDAFRVAIGEKPARLAPNRVNQTMIKWIALRASFAMAEGVSNATGSQSGGDVCTRPLDFQKDITQLLALIERFTAAQRDFQFQAHPILDSFLSGSGSAGDTCIWIITSASLVPEVLDKPRRSSSVGSFPKVVRSERSVVITCVWSPDRIDFGIHAASGSSPVALWPLDNTCFAPFSSFALLASCNTRVVYSPRFNPTV